MAKHGGKREGAGRKTKTDEQRLVELLSPMEPLALKALEASLSNPKALSWAVPLFFGYMYGKPKQTIDAKIDDNRAKIAEIFPKIEK